MAVVGTAASAAAVLALSTAPAASALDVDQQIYTTGPLLALLPLAGIDTVTIPLGDLPVVGDSNLILNFVPASPQTIDLYNLINTLPFQRRSGLGTPTFDRVVSLSGTNAGEFPMVLASGFAAANLVDTYRTQIASVGGTTPPGYTPFQPGPIVNTQQSVNSTNQVLVFLNNPLRPNGGIQSRFGPILNLFGVNTTVPAAGENSANGIGLNTATLDINWAYSPLSDFPVTLNPFAIANSLLAGLPTNLLGGVELQGLDAEAAGLNVASVLGIINRLSPIPVGINEGEGFYGTLEPNDLPLLEPLRLPSRLLNLAFGWDLGTPLADALQPALTILVNTGYTDVLTPAQGGTYNRTFDQSGDYVTYLSESPLTWDEWTQVPGDVLRALVVGFQNSFPLLRFGQTAPELVVDGNHLAIYYPPAPEVSPPAAAIARAAQAATPVAAAVPMAEPQSTESVDPVEVAVADEPSAPEQTTRRSRGPVVEEPDAAPVPQSRASLRQAAGNDGGVKDTAAPRRAPARADSAE
jgi:hypothetical protein